jgi:elongation factor G
MSIEVVVPEEYMEIILSDLNSRRGKIENMEHHAGGLCGDSIPIAQEL